jgi:hypothetical protein
VYGRYCSLHKELKHVCVVRQSWRGVVPVKLTEGKKNSDLTESLIGIKYYLKCCNLILYYLQDFMSLLNSPASALAVGSRLTDLRLEY